MRLNPWVGIHGKLREALFAISRRSADPHRSSRGKKLRTVALERPLIKMTPILRNQKPQNKADRGDHRIRARRARNAMYWAFVTRAMRCSRAHFPLDSSPERTSQPYTGSDHRLRIPLGMKILRPALQTFLNLYSIRNSNEIRLSGSTVSPSEFDIG